MIINKPLNYIRDFIGGELNNKIKYCIIKDTNIDYTCVACCVGVGSKEDPIEYQGLAHFLEHMLFLGSEKYRGADDFNDFISNNGGFSNAYTSYFETNYYYKINNDIKILEKSLDMFSHFFIDPLFNEEYVKREINAVHSEHSKNINNDFWLMRQIIINLSEEGKKNNLFSTGNLETLDKPNTRDEMKKFYDKFYCSDNITITLFSPNDCKEMEIIIKKYFNQISKKICKKEIVDDMPKYKYFEKEYQLIPVNNTDDFTIVYFFDIKYEYFYKDDKSIYILTNIIEDFNENGLYHYLKSKGFIHSLNVYINDEGILFIILEINKNKDPEIKKIVKEINNIMKNYLDYLQKINHETVYNYHVKKYNMNYDFGSKEEGIEMVQEVCVNMLHHKIENFYNGNKIVLKKDVTKFINTIKLINFNKANILYYYKNDLGMKNAKNDKYYGAKYGEINNSLIDYQDKNIEFKIVESNKYFEHNPTLINNLDIYEVPRFYDYRKWYGGVSKYKEYNVIGKLVFTNHSLYKNIQSYISTIISINVINYYLNLKFSTLMDIGYVAVLSSNSNLSNIILSINGLNIKYNDFFKEVIDTIQNINPSDDIIKNYINTTIIGYENIKKSSLLSYFDLMISYMTNKNIYHFKNILSELKNEKKYLKLIKTRINSIQNFKNLSLYSIFYGNIEKKSLPDTSILNENYYFEKVCLQKSDKIISKEYKKLNSNETNNLVVYSYYCCGFNPSSIVKTLILLNLFDNDAYSYLRTKEQLGYIVGATIKIINNDYYMFLRVQSSKYIGYIQEKMDKFIEIFKIDFEKKINNEVELKKIKDNLRKLINQESNGTNENFIKHFNEILLDRYFFNKNIILTNELDKVQAADIILFVNNLLKKKEILIIK